MPVANKGLGYEENDPYKSLLKASRFRQSLLPGSVTTQIRFSSPSQQRRRQPPRDATAAAARPRKNNSPTRPEHPQPTNKSFRVRAVTSPNSGSLASLLRNCQATVPTMADSSTPVLLRLPPSVRRRIYFYIGVARWDGLPLLFDLDGPLESSKQIAFGGLLLSCRTLYVEASALMFSANRFVIHYSNKRSLQPLRNLTPLSLASLASLKIVLNETSCHHRRKNESEGKCCDGPLGVSWFSLPESHCQGHYQGDYPTHHDGPLEGSHSIAGLMLDDWLRTAEYLSSRIRPRALELCLVCDVDQQETDLARKVVTPLSSFPELKECHIRLCRSPNSELAQIAQHAAQQACHRLEPHSPPSLSSSPRLLNLPRELRLHILGYTDLVTPWREVLWTRLERGYHYPSSGCSGAYHEFCPPTHHHGCQFGGCHHQLCVNYSYLLYRTSIGCFCRVRHAAFSSTCRCWAPPTPLFLVCHTLAEDARFVFFSLNRFVVSDSLASPLNPYRAFVFPMIGWVERHDGWGNRWYSAPLPPAPPPPAPPRPSAYPAQRFAASQFLRDVVPANGLEYLRFLELVFPPYNDQCWPQDGHLALQDWAHTLNWAKSKLSIPSLTLRLTMAGVKSISPEFPGQRGELSQAQGDEVLAGYNRILRPLACLSEGGLAHFYADFAWPWKWTNWDENMLEEMGSPEAVWDWLHSNEDILNEDAERFVLGDRYRRDYQKREREKDRPWHSEFLPGDC